MKKLTAVSSFVLLLILGFFSLVPAQSGRKTKSATLPTPAPQTDQKQENDPNDYSESAPSKTRVIYQRPTSNSNKNKPKSKSGVSPKDQIPADAQINAPVSGDGVEEEVLKVETNLVTIPVSVYERSGLYVSNLRRSDFKIFENGVEQELVFFGTSEKPFTVVLLIDTSPSTAYKIEEIQSAANAFVNQLKPEDSVMVIEFNGSVNVLTEVTRDRQKIYKAIGRTGFGDGTALYEAVDFSLRKRLDKVEGRKAIVLFTDGVDTASRSSGFDKTLGEAEESDAVIFPIYYNTFLASQGIGQGGAMSTPPTLGLPTGGGARGASSADYARGRAYLEALADLTGGRVFRPEATPGGLTAAFEGIAEELRSQYSIGYYPKEEGVAGERKKIKVRVNRPNVAVRARDSYIVGANETSPNTTNTPQKFK